MAQGLLKVRRFGQRAVITLAGDIDTGNAAVLGRALAAELHAGAAVLVVDATRARRCADSGVTVLVDASRRAEAAGAQLRVAARPTVRQQVTMGSDHILDTYPSLRAALAGPGQAVGQDGQEEEKAARTAEAPGVAG